MDSWRARRRRICVWGHSGGTKGEKALRSVSSLQIVMKSNIRTPSPISTQFPHVLNHSNRKKLDNIVQDIYSKTGTTRLSHTRIRGDFGDVGFSDLAVTPVQAAYEPRLKRNQIETHSAVSRPAFVISFLLFTIYFFVATTQWMTSWCACWGIWSACRWFSSNWISFL